MAEVASLYNSLPTLGEADEQFVNREAMLRALATLLAQYEYAFGLCLVHAHCKLSDTTELAEGEIMLAAGNVSQPKLMEHTPTYYPERWLSTGEPYEFTVRRTEKPPTELIEEFQRIVRDAKLQDILGLYHIDGEKDAPAIIEWTEGRNNLTREITDDDKTGEPIQTAWDFGRGDPVTMSCTIYCDQRTTRGSSVHKGI
ncbi:hypothetical protein F4804DRAFT_329728 [Jackrogersella minutella]|nr:hypothetical protein F4804DRAFT_329728 [Jackrogersella minutella]